MMNLFTKNYLTTPVDELNITDVEALIKDNPLKDQILKLHDLPVKSKAYNDLKNELPCISPHAIFEGSKKDDNVKAFSGLFYYDHDIYNTTHSLEDYSQYIINGHREHISMHGKSVGNRGLFTYISVANKEVINKDNFNSIYTYIKEEVLGDVLTDDGAKGISRYQYIPYDTNLYVNYSATIIIPSEVYNNNDSYSNGISILNDPYSKLKNTDGDIPSNLNTKRGIRSDVTMFVPLPFGFVLKNYHTKTPVKVKDPIVEVKPVEFVESRFPEKIKDGKKHGTFRMITNIFVHLNPDADKQVVQSYIYWLNEKFTTEPMELREMLRVVEDSYYTSIETGLWIKPKIKHVHFNPNCGLSGDEKKTMSARLTGERKTKTTLENIKNALHSLFEQNLKPTQINIATFSKVSLQTVKRYIKKNKGLIEDIYGYEAILPPD